MNSDVKGSRISDLMFDEEEIFEHTLITPITHYFEFSVNFPLIKIEHVTFNNKSKFHQLLGCQIHELKKEYISEKTSRKGGQNVKYVIFKSKNPFENQIFGRTIGRTGPKKEYMYSKRRTSGNPTSIFSISNHINYFWLWVDWFVTLLIWIILAITSSF
jgi:hypothetical protein